MKKLKNTIKYLFTLVLMLALTPWLLGVTVWVMGNMLPFFMDYFIWVMELFVGHKL